MHPKEQKTVKSTCGLCQALCGVLVQVEDGKPVSITGDPESPISKGALCSKGKHSLDRLFHPDRLRYPLKKVAGRGGDRWGRITWDEALDTIANKFLAAKRGYGPESIWVHMTCPRKMVRFLGSRSIISFKAVLG